MKSLVAFIGFVLLATAILLPIAAQIREWTRPAAAQSNTYITPVPSCDYGADWMREHNFKSCERTRAIKELCAVPDGSLEELKCAVIPNG